MSDIDTSDKTGQPPSLRDVDDAISAIRHLLKVDIIMKVPPELAVNGGNIRRCLMHLKKLMGGAP
jgi:hypothetical protein